jgi:hypothetical protein
MSNDNTDANLNRTARAKKLSPELNEFMHMLDALEDQIVVRKQSAASR